MSQKVIKIGSSLGVTLRGELLEQLGLEQGDSVSVAVNEKSGSIEIRSAKNEEFVKQVAEAQAVVSKYREQLNRIQGD